MVIDQCINKTLEFLINERTKSGWWRDFNTLAGYSDEWVTAYVGVALASSQLPIAQNAGRRAWKLLKRRRLWSRGWGYNKRVPKDTDSTTWALHLAERTGNEGSVRARRAYRFLHRSINSEGGLPTYPGNSPIRIFTKLKRNFSFEGWCSTHPSVSAAAANLDHLKNRDHLMHYLRAIGNEDGSWPAYWWCDNEYATHLAIRALARYPDVEDVQKINKATGWVLRRMDTEEHIATEDHPEGSPFASALALQILLESPQRLDDKIRSRSGSILSWLLKNQIEDGSWSSSARLRIPPPNERHPERRKNWSRTTLGGGSIRMDQNRLFTTATVLNALNKYLEVYKF